jgi:large subunit ribosomal protein L17
MRHKKSGRKFNRNSSHRRAMLRNLTANLVLHERIETTEAKAKELRRVAERLVTRALRLGEDLNSDVTSLAEAEKTRVIAARVAARRLVSSYLPARKVTKTVSPEISERVDLVTKVFETLAPRYIARVKAGKGGGYTRITKIGNRRGDNAPMAIIEFIEEAG